MRGVDVSGRDGAQGIVTHGVAVIGASSDGLYPNFIRGIANAGGGSFHAAADADTLLKSLLEIFNEIQAVNSVFASASLPVSVNARGTYLNQVYMGMFRPDADASPRWRGNLKQYKFGLDAVGTAEPGRRERRLRDQPGDRLHQPERGVVLDHLERLLEQPAARHAADGGRLGGRRDRREGRGRGAHPHQHTPRRNRRAACSRAWAARRARRSARPTRPSSSTPTRS